MKLWHKVLIGLGLGVVFGYVVGQTGIAESVGLDGPQILTDYIKPIGTVFINLIKMVVVPLILFSLISGITNMADASAFKRIGLKAITAFLMTGAIAVCIGIAFGEIFQPGLGVDLSQLQALSGNPMPTQGEAEEPNLITLLVNMIPTNVVYAMANDNILQVVVFAIFLAMTMNQLHDKAPLVITFCHQAAQVVFKLIETVIKFSPYGVFALTAWVVGTQGFDIIIALVRLIFVVMGALLLQYCIYGVMLVVLGRVPPMPFYKKMLEPQSLAFSTSSSKATLSTAMRVMHERMGISQTSTSFVLPLGASINMDGTAIYLAICVSFFAQAFGIELSIQNYIVLMLTATLGSIGAAGIPGGSLIMMGMVLSSVGLPLEGIALIAGIDRILDMMRTTVNVTSDCVITTIIDKSEGTLDMEAYNDMDR